MGWVYLDDRFPEHPKVLAAGDEAAWMFVCGLGYTNRGAGDGTIPKNAVARLTGLRNPARAARRLVEVGLWHDKDDVYAIHDYEMWNAQAMGRRAKARKAAHARWHPDDPESRPTESQQGIGSNANNRPGSQVGNTREAGRPNSATAGQSNTSDTPSNAQASAEHMPEHPPSSATAMQYPKPQAPIPIGCTDTNDGPDEPPQDQDHEPEHTPAIHALIDRWLTVIEKPTPLSRADANRWIPHLATILATEVIDQLIGQAAEQTPAPRNIKYLVASCRQFAAQHLPGTAIPDPPQEPT